MDKNKTKNPAIRMKAKLERKTASLLHCCIPETKANLAQEDAGKFYREIRNKRKEYLNKHFRRSIKGHHIKSKTPWFKLTKGKCFNYEERQMSWGAMTATFRVDSETKKISEKYKTKKFTRNDYVLGMVQGHVKKWEKTHPAPPQYIEGTTNAFFNDEHVRWTDERAKIWNKRLLSIKKRPAIIIPKNKTTSKSYKETSNNSLKAAA